MWIPSVLYSNYLVSWQGATTIRSFITEAVLSFNIRVSVHTGTNNILKAQDDVSLHLHSLPVSNGISPNLEVITSSTVS